MWNPTTSRSFLSTLALLAALALARVMAINLQRTVEAVRKTTKVVKKLQACVIGMSMKLQELPAPLGMAPANKVAQLQALPAPPGMAPAPPAHGEPPAHEEAFLREHAHGRVSKKGTNQFRVRLQCLDCGAICTWAR